MTDLSTLYKLAMQFHGLQMEKSKERIQGLIADECTKLKSKGGDNYGERKISGARI
jgi:hypothetical protein